MAERELRQMSRAELIEIIYALKQREEDLVQEKAALERRLADRTLRMEQAGNIAQAALELNHVFEAAQAAADQYLAQVHAANEQSQQLADRIVADAQRKANAIVQQAQQEADSIRAMNDEGAQRKWAELQEKTDTMLKSYEALRLALQK